MPREFVSRWAMVEELAADMESAANRYDEPTFGELATYLIDAGWRPTGGE